MRPLIEGFARWLAAVAHVVADRAADGGDMLLRQSPRRALPLHRRPSSTDRQFADRTRVPERRQAPARDAVRRQHRGRTPCLCPPRHCRQVPGPTRSGRDLPRVGLRATRHPPPRLSPCARCAHARLVQEHAADTSLWHRRARPPRERIPASLIGHRPLAHDGSRNGLGPEEFSPAGGLDSRGYVRENVPQSRVAVSSSRPSHFVHLDGSFHATADA